MKVKLCVIVLVAILAAALLAGCKKTVENNDTANLNNLTTSHHNLTDRTNNDVTTHYDLTDTTNPGNVTDRDGIIDNDDRDRDDFDVTGR